MAPEIAASTLKLLPRLICAGLLVFDISAQRPNHVRTYRAPGSYSVSISFSPGGSVIARSGDMPQLTILDGFTRRGLDTREESHFRVYQSRSGQLWSVAQEGLMLFHAGQWTVHSIPEIRNELQSNIRPLRQISLVPAEVNRVLILLPDRLLDYDVTTRAVRTLKFVRETQLGQFTEMQEGFDEAVWVAGTLGLARIPGPLRRIGPETEWSEHRLPDTNVVNNLQRPFEGPPGQVILSANSTGSDDRFIVQLSGDQWRWFNVPEERIRQAWRGWTEMPWGFSFNSLFRYDPRASPAGALLREPVLGRQYDVATEPGGAFWIATSEGIVRYAPFLWHVPPRLEPVQSPVHAILFEPDSVTNVWLSLPEGLLLASDRSLRLFKWPEELEAMGAPRGKLFWLPGRRVLIETLGRPFIFSPETGAFTPLRPPGNRRIQFFGSTAAGSVAAWFENAEGVLDLRLFDGTNFTTLDLPPVNWSFGELNVLEELPGGELWIGGTGGLLQVRTNKTVELHDARHGLPAEQVYAVAAVGDGRVWCGTESRVCEWRGQRWQVIFNAPDRVHSIVRAQGSIWIGTASGVYRQLGDSWISYTVNEGLVSPPIFTLRKDAASQLWAGTARGVAAFYPEADPDPPRTLPPALIEPAQPSTLKPTTISFHGQDKWDYTFPADLLFAYKLDEANWTGFSNASTRVFQNLSSGSHVLRVLAMDRNGNRSPAPAEITFSVVVPWFQDPRLLVVSVFALCLTLVLAGLAVNKHFQLKRSYAEVEKIVAQRTRELEKANRELLHSQKMRAIGTMAAGIAHDFNNILSIIKGSAQIIEGNPSDNEKIKTRVNRIQTVVEQGTTIVKALLGLGRMTEKDLAPCDLTDLLHETRRLLSDRFPETVNLHIDTAPGLPQVTCAHEVLQQMLLNLILNAVDALGGEGTVVLSARACSELPRDLILDPADGQSYISLSVIDQGIGIAPENLPRIFEPFFTTKAFSSRRGTGLGLSMVYELAKGFGYGLAVVTRPGEGSSFSIILPVNEAPAGWRQASSNAGISNS